MKSGVYAIVNRVTWQSYVGSSADIKLRWRSHKTDLNCGRHGNAYLRNAWKKYGSDAFAFEIIEKCEPDIMLQREQFYIDNSVNLYNLNPIATKPPSPKGRKLGHPSPLRGVPKSEETRRKISASKLGHPVSDETRQKQREAKLNKPQSPEHVAAVSRALTGKRRSPEVCRRISEAKRNISDATRKKMSESQKGRVLSDEHKENLRIAASNRPPQSQETRRKRSESMKRVHQQRKQAAMEAAQAI